MRNTLEMPQPYKTAPAIMGIFATRSPIRPNPIALTAVQIIRMDYEKGIIQIAYIDADDNTPVLDIKPYTPSLDRVEAPGVPNWCSHWPISLEQSENFLWENEFNF
jgi:tRNA (Thr-GGU) A37 N-methylase